MMKWLFAPSTVVFDHRKAVSPFREGACRALWKLSEAGFRFAFSVTPAELKTLRKTVLDQAFRAAYFTREGVQVELLAAGYLPGKDEKAGLVDPAAFFAKSRIDVRLSVALQPIPLALPEGLAALSHRGDWAETVRAVLERPRRIEVRRKTKETDIQLVLNPDGSGRAQVHSGLSFLDHMLEQVARHGGMDLKLTCKGDLEVDAHHTVEDIGIALGEALRQAAGDKLGLSRYGSAAVGAKHEPVSLLLPMDDALAFCALDFSGRAHLVFQAKFRREKAGDLPLDLVKHFFEALAQNAGINLHLILRGENDHHQVEAAFKVLARALRQALRRSGTELPSTKGAL